MVYRQGTEASFIYPDYDYGYGNTPELAALSVTPNTIPGQRAGFLPFKTLAVEMPFSEADCKEKLLEVRDNLAVVEDPKGAENDRVAVELTILNKDRLKDGRGVILQETTSNSGVVDSPHNDLEAAQMALLYPEYTWVLMTSPGNGKSTGLTKDEYRQALKDGRLVTEERDADGGIKYRPFETVEAIGRAIMNSVDNKKITHITGDDSAAHWLTAIASALPEGMERAFLYNPTNISDQNFVGRWLGMARQLMSQKKYQEASEDRFAMTDERREEAGRILGENFGNRLKEARSSTFRPNKMRRENNIYRRGPRHGEAAAVHAAAAMAQHPDLKMTYVFAEFSPNCASREDVELFIRTAHALGVRATGKANIQGFLLPVGHYWHSFHPSGRAAFQTDAFTR